MVDKHDEFRKKLLATFQVEAEEHLAGMSSGLLELETAPAGEHQSTLVEQVFRQAHSLKGAARSVSLSEVESVCQSMESVFAALKGGKLSPTQPLLDLLNQAIAVLNALIFPREGDASKSDIAGLVRQLGNALRGPASTGEPSRPSSPEPEPESATEPTVSIVPASSERPVAAPAVRGVAASGTIRVSTEKLDAVVRQTEELLGPCEAATQRAVDLRTAVAVLAGWRKDWARLRPTVRMMERSTDHLGKGPHASREQQALMKLFAYLDAESVHLKRLDDHLSRLEQFVSRDHRALKGIVNGLLHDTKEMHLLPFSSLTEMFPRVVRDLAHDQEKQVDLMTRGTGIEIDRRILEVMKDPFTHLIRNCVDHGIEKPAVRVRKGKPPRGAIRIEVAQVDSGKVEIVIADDGAGIDAAKVRDAAQRLNILTHEDARELDENQAVALTFRSGISTSPIITDLSGRGLGLAIVREKVERLGGIITVQTHVDTGTTFRIVLPLSLATFRGVLIRVGEKRFIIPSTHVVRVVRVAGQDIQTVENRETISLDEQAVSLVWFSDVLEMIRRAPDSEAASGVLAVVLELGQSRIAFRVDEILGEQEVLVKALGRQLARVRNVAGASVLGTGQVVPVLNVPDLMKSAVRQATAPRTPVVAAKLAEVRGRSILVAEDSITSRALIKNILESAGYEVTIAVDGIDAYTTLKGGVFDLLVSDVEMPRMDGFDLTSRVRADKQLSELPVILVTALESGEHRERGIDVGANAYIVKSSFDQSNLLEVVGRLI